MTYEAVQIEGALSITPDDFVVQTLEDEIRVDGLCKQLLYRFYFGQQEQGISPQEATALANSADYFVRDFVVGFKQAHLLANSAGLVRQFAGNWYIMNTLEPSIEELQGHLQGIGAFFRYLHREGLVSAESLLQVEDACGAVEYYRERIESFWAIEGDGYVSWEEECSLKSR